MFEGREGSNMGGEGQEARDDVVGEGESEKEKREERERKDRGTKAWARATYPLAASQLWSRRSVRTSRLRSAVRLTEKFAISLRAVFAREKNLGMAAMTWKQSRGKKKSLQIIRCFKNKNKRCENEQITGLTGREITAGTCSLLGNEGTPPDFER